MSETIWSLKGRTAFITGGSRGLGEAIAQGFLQAGANVAICARSAKELDQTEQRLSEKFSGQRVKAFTLDVTDLSAVTECLAAVLKGFGDLHVLVNNAGVYGPMGSLWLTSAEEWDAALRINIQGSLYPIRAAIPHFLKKGYGKIIQISEIGLVEITRQREERIIYDMFTKQCLVCQGLGYKRNEKVYNKLPNYFIEITSVFG